MRIRDPLNQAIRGYIVGGNNQPLLGHIKRGFIVESWHGNFSLYQRMFPNHMEQFILEHLKVTDPNLYYYIMNPPYGGKSPAWWSINNSPEFRDKFPLNPG